MTKTDRPLVTLALFAYNQEHYIREAVEGAFAQTYSPLEIILSDDCSSDRTFEIMQEMAAVYAGSHQLALNRMSKNSGLSNHINHVFDIAKGELLVVAAGDDISLPSRVYALVENWIQNNKGPGVIYSDIDFIDADSNVRARNRHVNHSHKSLTEFLSKPFALICSYSVSRDLSRRFPSLNSDLKNEDFIFPLRCLLDRRAISYVDSSLVMYRIGVGISQNQTKPTQVCRRDFIVDFDREISLWRQICSDVLSAGASNDRIAYCRCRLELATSKRDFCSSKGFLAAMVLVSMKIGIVEKLVFFLRVCFPAVHCAFRGVKHRIYGAF